MKDNVESEDQSEVEAVLCRLAIGLIKVAESAPAFKESNYVFIPIRTPTKSYIVTLTRLHYEPTTTSGHLADSSN